MGMFINPIRCTIGIFHTVQLPANKADVSLCGNSAIQLTNRTTNKVTRICIRMLSHILLEILAGQSRCCCFLFCFFNQRFIDSLEVVTGNDTLTINNHFTLERNFQRKIYNHFCIVGDVLTGLTITTAFGSYQLTIFVKQRTSKSVHFRHK